MDEIPPKEWKISEKISEPQLLLTCPVFPFRLGIR